MWKTISAGLCGLSLLTTPLFSAQTLEQQIGTANDSQNAPTAYGQLIELNSVVESVYNGVSGFSTSALSGTLFRAINKITAKVNSGNNYLVDTLFGQQVQFDNGLSTYLYPALSSLNNVIGTAVDQAPVSLSGSVLSRLQAIANQIPTDTTIGDSLENLGYFDITDFHSLTNWSFVTAPWSELNNTINTVTNPQNTKTWRITMTGGNNNTYTTGDLSVLFPGPSNTINIRTGDNIVFYGPGNAPNIGLIFQYTGTNTITSSSNPSSVFTPDGITLSAPSSLPNAALALKEAVGYLEPKGGDLKNWVLTTAPWEEANNTIDTIQVSSNKWVLTLNNSNTYETGDLTTLYPPSLNTDQINILTGFNVVFLPTSGIGGNFIFQYTGSTALTSTDPTLVFNPTNITLVEPSLTASIISVAQALQLANPIYNGSNLCQTIGLIRTQVI